jgi:hypothetical protein
VSTLQEQIAARQKQADERKIDEKASFVAKHLGDFREQEGDWSASYKDDLFEISARAGVVRAHDGDLGFCGTDVKFMGEIVYAQGGGTVSSFIPGAWEEELEALHAEAVPKAKASARAAERKRKTNAAVSDAIERKKWGL